MKKYTKISTKINKKGNKTRKNKETKKMRNKKSCGGAGSWFSRFNPVSPDDDLVNLYYNEERVSCYICNNKKFQKRAATLEKSKTQQGLFNFFTDSDGSAFNNTSVTSYFCNRCGSAIIVRYPQFKSSTTYTNLITESDVEIENAHDEETTKKNEEEVKTENK